MSEFMSLLIGRGVSHPAKREIGGWSECTLPSVRWGYLIFSSIPYEISSQMVQ